MGKTKYTKHDFTNLVNSMAEYISLNKENSTTYLSEQGIDPDEVKNEGLKRINKIKLQIEAARTKGKMGSTSLIKKKAVKSAKELMESPEFSFSSFITTHELSVQYRNIDSLSNEDIENTLIQYFYLKYLGEEEDNSSEK